MTARMALPASAPHVLQVATLPNAPRAAARSLVRVTLCEWLSQKLEVEVRAHDFVQDSDGPLRWQPQSPTLQQQPLSLSIAHAPGLSLVAIGTGSAVGMDVMHLSEIPASLAEMMRLLADYAGPQAAASFTQQLDGFPAEAPALFAMAWTSLEAHTKCNGQALSEWQPGSVLTGPSAAAQQRSLALPSGYYGHLAWRD